MAHAQWNEELFPEAKDTQVFQAQSSGNETIRTRLVQLEGDEAKFARVIERVMKTDKDEEVLETLSAAVPGIIIVRIIPGSLGKLEAQALSLGHHVGSRLIGGGETYRIHVQPSILPSKWVSQYSSKDYVTKVEVEGILVGNRSPNDSDFSNQWHHDIIGSPRAWDRTTGCGPLTAVIDTGGALGDQDIAPGLWINPGEIPGNNRDDDGDGYVDNVNGADVTTKRGQPFDEDGHGTVVDNLFAGAGNNGRLGAGVTWLRNMMHIKAMKPQEDGKTWGTVSDLTEAVYFASKEGVKVANHSYGGPDDSPNQSLAFSTAHFRGMLSVVAAGNDNNDNDENPQYPASYNHTSIISVAGSNRNDHRYYSNTTNGTNFGVKEVDVYAPGQDLRVYRRGNRLSTGTGTSYAAPLVAGQATLLRCQHPSWSPSQVRSQIMRTVDQKSAFNNVKSGGRINIPRSLGIGFPTLTRIEILGANQMGQNSSLRLYLRAYYSNGSSRHVTSSADWSENSPITSINAGSLQAYATSSTATVLVTARYVENGVIRSASHVVTISSAPTLQAVYIQGGTSVQEASTIQLRLNARYSDGSMRSVVTPQNWVVRSSNAEISTRGVFRAAEVSRDTFVQIYASYTDRGITKYDYHYVRIQNVPKPKEISIIGPTQLNEKSSDQFKLKVTYDNGETRVVTAPVTWSDNSRYAAFNSSGMLKTYSVSEDTPIVVQATYREGDVYLSDKQKVLIRDIRNANLSSISIVGATSMSENSSLQLQLRANYSDGSSRIVTPSATWSDNADAATISSGLLRMGSVSVTSYVTIRAVYTENGSTQVDTHGVLVPNTQK